VGEDMTEVLAANVGLGERELEQAATGRAVVDGCIHRIHGTTFGTAEDGHDEKAG
jgi:hypothetical protein